MRKIIEIDHDKCDGCGVCIPDCPEGALQIIDGKARLVSDLLCDGLGACLGTCPRGALSIVERPAEAYDERKVLANIIPQGEATLRAHLKHLKDHNEHEFYAQAISMLKEENIPVPVLDEPKEESSCPPDLPCGCPGTLSKLIDIEETPCSASQGAKAAAPAPSALRQWPVQLQLLNPTAPYFDDADLLISADCVAHAHGGFHTEMLPGKILIILCPKLDGKSEEYVEKLAAIFKLHKIKSITVARMEVPCCTGIVTIVEKALQEAGLEQELKTTVVKIDGQTKEN